MAKQIYYDLTELMAVKGSKFRVYGIARVVSEVAKYLPLGEVQFVFHSADHDRFFRVYPVKVDAKHLVDFNLPDIKVLRYRERLHRKNLKAFLTKVLLPAVRAINLKRWDVYDGTLEEVDLSNGILFTSARPKLISNMIMTIKRKKSDVALVPLLHDLIPLHDFGGPNATDFQNSFFHDNKFVMQNSAYLMANSQFTADDIVRFSDQGHFAPATRIVAVPLVHEFLESGEDPQIDLPTSPYFLMVGTSMGRKNLDVVFDAYRDHLSKGANVPKLVLAGAIRKTTVKALNSERYAAIKPHVEFVDRPNETDLKRLYQGATALIISSRIEGWGLPAGEALWFGTPAICARIPVLKEVCGDLGIYFDVDDPKQLADQMTMLLQDDAYRSSLRERIAEAKPRLRTWKTVADDVYKALST